MRHPDRNQIWKAAKAAVHAYEAEPSTSNASRVATAFKGVRELNETSVRRQWKGIGAGEIRAPKD